MRWQRQFSTLNSAVFAKLLPVIVHVPGAHCLSWLGHALPLWVRVPSVSAACCRQLDALPDQVVQGVGRSHQMNSNWNELEIDMNQNVHNTGTVSEEFSMAMEVWTHAT